MTTDTSVFLYGTLCDPELYRIVAGTEQAPQAARLAGYCASWAKDQSFPLIHADPDGMVEGILVRPSPRARERLDFYELGFGYDIAPLWIDGDGGREQALVYLPPENTWSAGPKWSLETWQANHALLAREAAIEYMRLIDTLTPENAAKAFPQVRMRADSRLRARALPSPSTLPPAMSASSVATQKMTQPYTDYFAVREDILTFPRFDGSSSPLIKRASFQGGDAVTVLPYDPKNDTVLVVRQFRHGPFCRGDQNPWTLEPAAGRIDPTETPEDAARRELFEEVGITASSLHPCGRYYPSPGAYSEFLFSYVALADLTEWDGVIGGLSSEAEDIISHVIPLDQALKMASSGEANTGPLLISLTWLALNRDNLRKAPT